MSNNGGCDLLTTCTNNVGSHTCSACPSGYTGTGASGCIGKAIPKLSFFSLIHFSIDINECLNNNGGCDHLTTCINSAGSYSCGACPSGYTGTGATSCVGTFVIVADVSLSQIAQNSM